MASKLVELLFQRLNSGKMKITNETYLPDLMYTVLDEWEQTLVQITEYENAYDALEQAFNNLRDYINKYFDDLDVQNEINAKLDDMVKDGSFGRILSLHIPSIVNSWLNVHVSQPTTPIVDNSLLISGAAADSKTVGDKINKINSDKMERYVVRVVNIVGNISILDYVTGATISFDTLYSAVRDTSKYVVCVYGNTKLRPQFVGQTEIIFTGLNRDAIGAHALRMIVRADSIQLDSLRLADERQINTINEISDKVTELNNDKMERYIIRLINPVDDIYSIIDYVTGEPVSFDKLYSELRDKSKYVVCVHGEHKLRPQFVGINEIIFTGLSRDSIGAYALRMIVRVDSVQYDSIKLADEKQIHNINEDISELNDDLVELDSRLSESIYDISNIVGFYEVAIDSATVLVPFNIPKGTTFKIYSADGEALPSNQFRLYDADKAYIDYFTLNSTYGNERTVTNTKKDCYYVALNTNSSRKISAKWCKDEDLQGTVADTVEKTSVLRNDVDTLKSLLEDGSNLYTDWARVSWSRVSGGAKPTKANSTTRISFSDLLFVKANTKVHVETVTGQQFARIAWTLADGKYTNVLWGGWETEPIDWIPSVDSYICVACSKTNTSETITLEELGVTVKVFDSILLDHEKRITALESELSERFVSEMNETIASVRNCMTEPCLVFPKITDIHYAPTSTVFQNFDETIKNMKYFVEKIHCDFIANLGDNINGSSSIETSLSQADHMLSAFNGIGIPYLFAIGNHDTNYDPSPKFDIGQTYRAFMSATPKNAIINKATNGTDFYIDYDGLGIRIVFINTNYLGAYIIAEDTKTWFINTVLDTDKLVVLCEHMSTQANQNFSNKIPSATRSEAINSAISTFISNGGKFIQLFGHSHCDYAFTTPWLSIASTCGKFEQTDTTLPSIQAITDYETTYGLVSPSRTQGTATEQAWDVVVIRPMARKVNLIRFGAGVDREFDF